MYHFPKHLCYIQVTLLNQDYSNPHPQVHEPIVNYNHYHTNKKIFANKKDLRAHGKQKPLNFPTKTVLLLPSYSCYSSRIHPHNRGPKRRMHYEAARSDRWYNDLPIQKGRVHYQKDLPFQIHHYNRYRSRIDVALMRYCHLNLFSYTNTSLCSPIEFCNDR